MTVTYPDAPVAPAADTGTAAGPPSRLLADTRYVVTGFPLALAAVTLCVTGVAAGIGLAVLWIGIPVAIAALMLSRRFATAERARIATVLGAPVREPAYRTARTPATTREKIAVLTDPQSWRDLAHAAVRFIPSTIGFAFVVTWWAGMLGGLTWSLWGWALPDGPDNKELPELLGLGDAYLTMVVFYFVVALLLAVTLPAVARGAAHLEARFARALLGAGRR